MKSPNQGVNLTAITSAALTRRFLVAQQVTPDVILCKELRNDQYRANKRGFFVYA